MQKELEVLVPGKPFQQGLMLVGKARGLPKWGAADEQALILLRNIRLYWKGLPVTNALA